MILARASEIREARWVASFLACFGCKGRYMDNIFVERLWRSLKYEQVYLNTQVPFSSRQPAGTTSHAVLHC
jgi:transposase InsO family protein